MSRKGSGSEKLLCLSDFMIPVALLTINAKRPRSLVPGDYLKQLKISGYVKIIFFFYIWICDKDLILTLAIYQKLKLKHYEEN